MADIIYVLENQSLVTITEENSSIITINTGSTGPKGDPGTGGSGGTGDLDGGTASTVFLTTQIITGGNASGD